MSLETAIKVLETMPTPEVKAAAKEATQPKPETKADNGVQSTTASNDKSGGVDGKVAEAPAPTPKDDPKIASQFAALAKKEKAIVRQSQDIKSKSEAIAQKEKEIAAREAKIRESEEIWDKDVFKALELRGYDYKKLTDLILKGETAAPKKPLDPEEAVAKALEKFKAEQAEKETAQKAEFDRKQAEIAEAQKIQLEEAYKNYRAEVGEFVKANEETYELTALYGQEDLIVDTVQAHFDNTGKVLSIEESAKMVEAYLEDLAKKAVGSKKFSKASEKVEDKKEIKAPTKTLSNNLTPNMASNLPNKTENDRMKRALAKLQ